MLATCGSARHLAEVTRPSWMRHNIHYAQLIRTAIKRALATLRQILRSTGGTNDLSLSML